MTSADIEASNGIIHVVDGVIGLPTIVNHAAGSTAPILELILKQKSH